MYTVHCQQKLTSLTNFVKIGKKVIFIFVKPIKFLTLDAGA